MLIGEDKEIKTSPEKLQFRMENQDNFETARRAAKSKEKRFRDSFQKLVEESFAQSIDPIKVLEEPTIKELRYILGTDDIFAGKWAKVIRFANNPEEYIGSFEKIIDMHIDP